MEELLHLGLIHLTPEQQVTEWVEDDQVRRYSFNRPLDKLSPLGCVDVRMTPQDIFDKDSLPRWHLAFSKERFVPFLKVRGHDLSVDVERAPGHCRKPQPGLPSRPIERKLLSEVGFPHF